LPVALGGGQSVGSDRQRLHVAVVGAQKLAVPHVRQPEALVVAGEDSIAVGGRDQFERRAEMIVGVRERAFGDVEREGRTCVVGGLDRCAGLLEHGTRFVDPTGGDEIVKEAGQVACAYALGEVGEVQGKAPGADPDLW
jgi:hypothetical protein